MPSTCIGTPLSRLTLERYVLGELPSTSGSDARQHLEACARCRAVLKLIEGDVVRLPPLAPATRIQAPRWRGWLRVGVPGGLVAVAALVLFFTLRGPSQTALVSEEGSVKGDMLTLELVRERSGAIAIAPETFARGDRFKVRVTCGYGDQVRGEVAVIQDDGVFTPLPPVAIPCGNRVVIDGAFSLDGGAAQVCFFADATRDDVEERARDLDGAPCALLQPER